MKKNAGKKSGAAARAVKRASGSGSKIARQGSQSPSATGEAASSGEPASPGAGSISPKPHRESLGPSRPAKAAPVPLVKSAPEAAPAKTEKPAKPVKRTRVPRSGLPKKKFDIPPILLEGDLPLPPKAGGPGIRYALAAQPIAPVASSGGELPEAYGTGRLFLAARDPHWLYASWDFTDEQQRALNKQSRDGHLVLRVFAGEEPSPVVPEVHVHPESKHWFINVPRAETRYRALLGYDDSAGAWKTISTSQSTFTPPEAPSADVSADFATIPAEVTFQQVVEMVQDIVTENQPLLEAVLRVEEQRATVAQAGAAQEAPGHAEAKSRSTTDRIDPAEPPAVASIPERSQAGSGAQSSPAFASPSEPSAPARHKRRPTSALPIQVKPGKPWTREQNAALKRLIHMDGFRRVWMGSIEITELIRRQLQEEISSITAAKLAAGAAEGQPVFELLHVSSPPGGQFRKERKFWFKVNAELVIYGATEPDATVRVAGRAIKLRPDGTFSFRFSLPDGRYQLAAVAISGDGEEGRAAYLEFSRSSEYSGEVEPFSGDETLRPPRPENIH